MKKLFLIDGNNLLFRSYYATAYSSSGLMQTKDGAYTNAIFGFVRAMRSVYDMDFTHMLVALDAKGKTIRHEKYEDYKGLRKKTPDELLEQIPLLKEYLDAAKIPWYEQQRYEADDIIGYVSKHHKDRYDEIVIYSNDKDLIQLVDEDTKQLVSKTGFSDIEYYTDENTKDKLGIEPKQMVDYKALVGDPSDNIPGIKGIGDKTAVKLLGKYQTLDGIYENIDAIKGKLKERLVENEETARFSKELATIIRDFDNDLDDLDMSFEKNASDELRSFYEKLEFHSFIKKMDGGNHQKETVDHEYLCMEETDSLDDILSDHMAVHLELFGTNNHTAKKIGFGLVNEKGSYFIPYDVFEASKSMQSWLSDPNKQKDVFNLKKLKLSLAWDGYDVAGITFDMLLGAYLANPSIASEDVRKLVSAFDYQDVAYDEEVYGRNTKYHLPDDVTVVHQHIVDKALAVKKVKSSILEDVGEAGLEDLLYDVEMPLASILADMEYEGIRVDPEKLESIGKDLNDQLEGLEEDIQDMAGKSFNVNSPKQLSEVLFEDLGLAHGKKTKTGYSTNIKVLRKLSGLHPIIDNIIQYRKLEKLKSTYYQGLRDALSLKSDGRIHTIYKQAVTQTGRLSSIEPNLQNIPIRTEAGRKLRKIFVADVDHELFSCDYSQVELRVLAEMAGVEKLKEAFKEDKDIHTHTATLIFDTDDIDSTQRRQAKAINFGIIYGKTPWGLSEDLQISRKKAEAFIDRYYEIYPEIKDFMDEQIDMAKTKGYVKTMFDRRRYIPEINHKNYQTRQFGERMARNAPIQGSAADILKIAMVKIAAAIEEKNLKTKMLLQIHDEIVFDVPADEKDTIRSIVKEHMAQAVDISVPLTVDMHFGTNLYEVK